MITEEQFKAYIGQISDSYEAGKDAVYRSELGILSPDAQAIIKCLVQLRDIACTALRESHTTKNFNDN